jgi:ApbE superfamily uncharacterized protein (UPF0280 family)
MSRNKYRKRAYRSRVRKGRLVPFEVKVKETDLLIHGNASLKLLAREMVLKHRGYIETYIQHHPEFVKTLTLWPLDGPAPRIIRQMIDAGNKAGVGPMAAVAGAIAEAVGIDLLSHENGLKEVVVENGGDLFIKTDDPMTIGIFAGGSPLSFRVGLQISSAKYPIAVCTSSGTVGHSLSFGKADAVCVISRSCSLADAAATSIGNRISSKQDIKTGIDFGKKISEIDGILLIVGGEIGVWGELDMVPLDEKSLEF